MKASQPVVDAGVSTSPHTFAPFRRTAVLGAGTMGVQIAAHLANAGLDVLLFDVPALNGPDRDAVVNGALKQATRFKPSPFFEKAVAGRIVTGNFEDHLDRLSDAEWIVEAIVERLEVKRALFERVESVARPDAIVSTNTSGLSIAAMVAGRSEGFRRRFLGTHFFNPPRYLELLELIPSPDTDASVLARIAHFGRIHLGKGIVVAKDTPYFIGNRIGIYALFRAIRACTGEGYAIEEVDALTGVTAGRPRSATFRTADVVGLDVMLGVAQHLHAAVTDDESRSSFEPPTLLKRLVGAGRLGQKTGAGFYKKEGGEIRSVDPESLEYVPARPVNLPELRGLRGAVEGRLRALYEAGGRTGAFFRPAMLDLMAYAARRIPEIADRPAEVDRALRWGFGWELGPFETWDVLGFERVLEDMQEGGFEVPSWVEELAATGQGGFYRRVQGGRSVYVLAQREIPGAYVADPLPADELSLDVVKSDAPREMWSSDSAGLLDLGDGVALFEFRSKANTLGRGVMAALRQVIERIEGDASSKGLVVGNEGRHFSVGANLAELAQALLQGALGEIDRYIAEFQETIQRLHYARKPVVVAAHQRVLGGGCELMMACPNQVASAECYAGLVELGVGLIPAGTGTMRLAAMAAERSPNGHPSEIQPWVHRFFETVAMSRVSSSAREAQSMGFLAPCARIVMRQARRLHVAREEVLRLSAQGYRPPERPVGIQVLGRPTAAALNVMAQQFLEGRFISEYDAFLAGRLAYVLTGGDLTAPQVVDEAYLIDLERSVFLELVQQKKTQDRVAHILKTKKPLGN